MKITALIALLIFSAAAFAQIDNPSNSTDDKPGSIITAEDAKSKALTVGDKMPEFTLINEKNIPVLSAELLKKGNLVLVFYRGAWCPYCNLYLRSLQKNLDEIIANGGHLVAVSVEDPDNSLSLSQKNELKFTVLSDGNLNAARKFNIVYQLPADLDEKYKSYGIDLVKQNNTKTPDLPLSATYIIDKMGVIRFAFLEPDYRLRAEPDVIIRELEKLKPAVDSK